jgi:3-oxoacyl-[acyl-carrier protein] reductase
MLTLDLSGKIAVVTGGAGELGRTMSRTLGRCGADVIVHYNRSQGMAEQLADELREMGRRAFAVQADVTKAAEVERLRDETARQLGNADIIVDNAVAQYPWKSVLEQPLEDYVSQFESCVLHNVLMAKAFVPAMIEGAKGGRIIGINTECAMQCFPSQSAYVAGKRGMDGVLRVLAKEIGPHGITVNQVAPGWTISDRDRAGGTEQNEAYSSKVPLRRRGTDQEIANVVAFLASDLSSYITGAYIPVCGGNEMPCI